MDGISGQPGTSLFICKYSKSKNDGIIKFGNCIRSGSSTSGSEEYIGRSYINGDAFLFPDGDICKIIDIKKIFEKADNLTIESFNECMLKVGEIQFSEQDNRFSSESGRFVLDTDTYQGFLINFSDSKDFSTIDSPFTIISDAVGNDGMVRFVDMRSVQAGLGDSRLRIYFDNDRRCFVIESNNPIMIDADLQVSDKNMDDNSKYDEYSRVLVSENSLTKFRGLCSKVSYERVVLDNTKRIDDLARY